jgi:hypothetical protein
MAWGRKNNLSTVDRFDDRDLPRIFAQDAEIVCMIAVLDELKRLEAVKGVRARERAMQWVMHRLGEDDHERMDNAKPVE